MMITVDELSRCIQKLSPEAKVTICKKSPDSEPYAVYAPTHSGPKPTLAECEAVLPLVRAEMQKEQAIPAIQAILDSKAREYGFDTIHTAAVWTISKNPARAARAQVLVDWADSVWDFAEAEWAKAVAGESTYTTVEDFMIAVPGFTE